MFSPLLIELGELKPKKEIEFHFNYDDEVKLITSILSPCGCTRVTNDIPNRSIIVNFTPEDVPLHIRAQGRNWYDTAKVLKIEYLNTSNAELKQQLVFTAKIKR